MGENGTIVNPFDIEEALREHPLIDDAAVFGNGKNKLVALLTPDEEQISNESEKLNKTPEQFLESPELKEMIGKHVDKINDEIDDDNKKLNKFLILDKPFSIDEGELTPEGILNRDVIGEKHSGLLSQLMPCHDFSTCNPLVVCPFCHRTPVDWKTVLNLPNYDDLSKEEIEQHRQQRINEAILILEKWRNQPIDNDNLILNFHSLLIPHLIFLKNILFFSISLNFYNFKN